MLSIKPPILYKPKITKTYKICKPCKPCKSIPIDIPYLVGKSVILFTFFYTSLNWYMYRKIRKENEKEDHD